MYKDETCAERCMSSNQLMHAITHDESLHMLANWEFEFQVKYSSTGKSTYGQHEMPYLNEKHLSPTLKGLELQNLNEHRDMSKCILVEVQKMYLVWNYGISQLHKT